MKHKNDTKRYLKFNLLTFLVLFFFSHSSIFGTRVNAEFEAINANLVYKTALDIINEKFYFKPKINLDKWRTKFENKINDLNDAHRYVSKLIKALDDPYTKFLTKEEFKDEQDIINSTLIGIGVKLEDKKPIVLDVLEESPARNNDIRPNDYLLSINSKSTWHLTSRQVANLMRGPKGTTFAITIKRGKEILTKQLTREELKFKSVSTKLLGNDLALVKINSFIPDNTSKLFKDEILKLASLNGIIIDIRNNNGGLFKNAVEIADMFLSQGKIVTTLSKNHKTNEYANSNLLSRVPIVILVNENTASASEILASALKENKRAITIGKQTFGKGLVQEVVKLPDDSALHVTTAAYLTPTGKNIDKVGLIPDEIVYDEKEQVEKAKEILLQLTLIKTKDTAKLALLQ